MTDAQTVQIKELRMQGQGYRAIGAAVGLSLDIVRNYCKANGMDGYARAMALNMQACMVEAAPGGGTEKIHPHREVCLL